MRRLYSCGGFRSYSGPCGAPDCTSCNPSFQGWTTCERCSCDVLMDGGTSDNSASCPDGDYDTLCDECYSEVQANLCEWCGEEWSAEDDDLCADCRANEEAA